MSDGIVLSVVTSTYNRADLVCNNLRRMLRFTSSKIEFIVGDNASEDNTLERLQKIDDARLHIYHNEENYGLSNVFLLSLYARGKYVITVNDRDYVKQENLRFLCEKLEKLRDCDFVATGGRLGLQDGYYDGEYIPKFYVYNVHPGRVIYSRELLLNTIDEDVKRLLMAGEPTDIPCRLVCGAKKAYLLNREVITKPRNIEKIPRRRQEPYSGEVHLFPKAVTESYIAFYKISMNWSEYPYMETFRLAQYRAFLQDTTYNFFYAMKDEGWKRRYGVEEHMPREWLANGITYLVGVLRGGVIKDKKLRIKLITATIQLYVLAIKQIVINSYRSIFG